MAVKLVRWSAVESVARTYYRVAINIGHQGAGAQRESS